MQTRIQLYLVVLTLLLLSFSPLHAEEILDRESCGGETLSIRAGVPELGFPHWDPVIGVLQDRVEFFGMGEGLPSLLLLQEAQGVDLSTVLRNDSLMDRSIRTRGESFLGSMDLLLQGENAPASQWMFGVSDGCENIDGYAYFPGRDVNLLEAPDNRIQTGTPQSKYVVYRYDQSSTRGFVGSTTGWFVAGLRFPHATDIQVLETRFVVAPSAVGSEYELMVFHASSTTRGLPTLSDLVYTQEGTIQSTSGEEFLIQVPLVEAQLEFGPGTLWVGLRNKAGQSFALAVDNSVDWRGNAFLSTNSGESFHPFGWTGPADGIPKLRVLVEQRELLDQGQKRFQTKGQRLR